MSWIKKIGYIENEIEFVEKSSSIYKSWDYSHNSKYEGILWNILWESFNFKVINVSKEMNLKWIDCILERKWKKFYIDIKTMSNESRYINIYLRVFWPWKILNNLVYFSYNFNKKTKKKMVYWNIFFAPFSYLNEVRKTIWELIEELQKIDSLYHYNWFDYIKEYIDRINVLINEARYWWITIEYLWKRKWVKSRIFESFVIKIPIGSILQ